MTDLKRLREAWERAEARLHAHLPEKHRDHLPSDLRAGHPRSDTDVGDDTPVDPAAIDAAAEEARVTYDAYIQGVRTLGRGLG
jgi:hypothetical protein